MAEKLPTISAQDALQQLNNVTSSQSAVNIEDTEAMPSISAQDALKQLGQDLPSITAQEVESSIVRPTGEEDLGWWKNHQYAWDATLSPSRELSEWATRNNFLGQGDIGAITLGWDGEQWAREDSLVDKLGAFVTTPEERGVPDNFSSMSTEERRKVMLDIYEKELAEQNPEVAKQGGAEGIGSFTGTAGALILDPTVAIPVTGTGARAFASGGALAGTYTAAETQRKTGKVNPLQTAVATVAGGAISVLANKAIKVIGTSLKQKTVRKAKDFANKTVDTANDLTAKLIASEKYTADNVLDAVAIKMKLTPFQINKLASKVGRTITIPDVDTAKIIDAQGLLPKDPLAVSTLSRLADTTSNWVNRLVQPLSSYVKNKSAEFDGMIKKYDHGVHQRAAKYETQLKPFNDILDSLDETISTKVHLNLMNQNFEAVEATLKSAGVEADSFKAFQILMKEISKELKNAGISADIVNFFPRLVTDLKGIRTKLGIVDKSAIDKIKAQRLKSLNSRRKNKRVRLSGKEEDAVMNDILSGKIKLKQSKASKSIGKARQIVSVTEDMLPYYGSPTEALKSYVRQASAVIEQAKLFGKNKVVNEAEDAFDSEASIGMLLNELKTKGKITSVTEAELVDVMQVYFGNGAKSPSRLISELKAFGYIQTLGNFQSTLTQIKDLGMSAYAQGLLPTIKAMVPGMSSKGSKVTARQQGLDEIIAQEYNDAGRLSKALSKILEATGFRALDRFGKSTTMTAALNKWSGKTNTTKGLAELKQKYGESFPNDFDQLIIDLQSKKQTPLTDLLAWHELTRTQPISAYEMPISYLNNPDLRILYSLKSFMLKQLQLVRDDIFNIAKTKPVEASVNAMRYAVMLNLAGIPVDITKDMLLGRPVNQDRIKEYALANMLSFSGVNSYIIDRYLVKGDLSGFLINFFTPSPVGLLNDVVQDVMGVVKEKDPFENLLDNKQPSFKTIGNVPFVGNYVENYFFGGREKAIKRSEKGMFDLN